MTKHSGRGITAETLAMDRERLILRDAIRHKMFLIRNQERDVQEAAQIAAELAVIQAAAAEMAAENAAHALAHPPPVIDLVSDDDE